ncbi:AcrR family transcriptional regulator [Hamadaea flava]|uniref:TetR/AcrR family transcriptional regulator n=1 Tax=Hamadaea flava TaxID=1742688 RepID=A0ABV8LZV3_9ACTN|nr:TetR/AcrR family transcriptional regulator [Hamadaea flava]MCP2328897.1 AcrR family transcriptional regulator [Hamadaea flava]
MPKIVDHEQRRRELAAAVWQVIAEQGVDEVSIRTVAAAAGWSTGALRHYFATRGELLAFACEQVIDQVTERIRTLPPPTDPVRAVRAILLETMPVDERRRTEASIAFSFLALGLGDPELARVQRRHFTSMYELCVQMIEGLAAYQALAPTTQDVPTLARRMHAVVDGLTVHALAGHLTADEMVAQLNAYLSELTGQDAV